MNSAICSGTQIAVELLDSSPQGDIRFPVPNTLGELLDLLKRTSPGPTPVLKTTASLLATYLNESPDQLTLAAINADREGFRPFLETRKYAKNSIRTYVNHVHILLRHARTLGWEAPSKTVPDVWRDILALSERRRCGEITRYLISINRTPKDNLVEDLNHWAEMRVQCGRSYTYTAQKKGYFWRVLSECGYRDQVPISSKRDLDYRVPLAAFPPTLKRAVLGLLAWKKMEFAVGRPKGGRHRDVSARQLSDTICGLFGFATKVLKLEEIDSLQQLLHQDVVSAYLEWSINERKVKGYSLLCPFRLLSAAIRQYPPCKTIDVSWLKPLLDSLPVEPQAELRKRKAAKYVDYSVVEAIPAKIRSKRAQLQKDAMHERALLARDELLVKWLTVLPWRQRNIRECRIAGSEPNLFKGPIPRFSNIDKPAWVEEEEQRNPQAEFWQFRFNIHETKTKIDVHAVLPRQLIGLVEEYLRDYRPLLARDKDPGTLFLNGDGNALAQDRVSAIISALTVRYAGRRVTPHLFRDIFAFTWLKEHPKDYLTLSKILWHSNINTTIRIYGSRFNESSGVCSTEAWLDSREQKLA